MILVEDRPYTEEMGFRTILPRQVSTADKRQAEVVMQSKKCTKCGEVKPLEEYAKNSHTYQHSGSCKVCENKRRRELYAENPERHKAYVIKHRETPEGRANFLKSLYKYRKSPKGKKMSARWFKGYKVRSKLNLAAHRAVVQAKAKGQIVQPPHCEDCNKEVARLHAHHADYSKQLSVEWLCYKCHKKRHKAINDQTNSGTNQKPC